MLAFKYLAPALSKSQGAAVFFSSIAASVGFSNHSAIAAAKVRDGSGADKLYFVVYCRA
jgi:hypothetical protein